MAAKEPEKGLRDPFHKWGVGGSAEAASAIAAPVAAAQAQLAALQKQLNIPGLASKSRQLLLRELALKKKELADLDRAAKRTFKDIQSQKGAQLEILSKLSGIRSQLATNGLDKTTVKTLLDAEKRLEELYKTTKSLKYGDLSKLLSEIQETQKNLEALPDDVVKALGEKDEVLQRILEKQQEARDFLKQQREDIKGFAKDIGKKFVGFGADLAERIGFGKFNLANVVRGVVGTAKGIYKGTGYAIKTVRAIRDSRRSAEDYVDPGESNEKDPQKTIAEKFSEYVASTRVFQRRMIKAAEATASAAKKKDAGKESGGILDSIASLFGSKGVIASVLSTIGGFASGKLLPMLGGLLRGGLRVLGPLGALYGSFEAGHWVGTQLNKIIAEPLANVIDYFMLPDMNGKTGLQKSFDSAMQQGKEVSDAAMKAFSAAKTQLYEKASAVWDAGKNVASAGAATVKEKLGNVASTASTAVSSGVQTAKTAVVNTATSAYGAVSEGSTAVKDWVGSLFTKQSNVNVDGLNPAMQKNMVGMAQEYYALTGKKLRLTSGFRSRDHQAHLYKTMPKGKAAPPGRSLHEYGFAFDADPAQANELAKAGLLSKYGFSRPIKDEDWHIQPAGMSLAAAKAGIYSADGPVNQAKATPQTQAISAPEPKIPMGSSAATPSTSGMTSLSKGTAQPSTRVGTADIPTFDMGAAELVAVNLGVLQ